MGIGRKRDGRAVVEHGKASLIEDTLFPNSTTRADGQVLRGRRLQVKAPAASHGARDYCAILRNLPAAGLYVPLSEGGRKLIRT